MVKVTRPLTKKETSWLKHYKVSGNATESARVAGYSGDNLHIVGHQIKSRLIVNLEKDSYKIAKSKDEQVNEVVNFWISIMNSNDAPNRDKIQCSKLYATYLGMFNSQNQSNEQDTEEDELVSHSMDLLSYEELLSIANL